MMSEIPPATSEQPTDDMPAAPLPCETRQYHWIAYFFGGVFLANSIPHQVNGMSG